MYFAVVYTTENVKILGYFLQFIFYRILYFSLRGVRSNSLKTPKSSHDKTAQPSPRRQSGGKPAGRIYDIWEAGVKHSQQSPASRSLTPASHVSWIREAGVREREAGDGCESTDDDDVTGVRWGESEEKWLEWAASWRHTAQAADSID